MLEGKSLIPTKCHCKTLNFRIASSHGFSLLLKDGRKQANGSEAKMRLGLNPDLRNFLIRLDVRKLQPHSQHRSMGDGSCLLAVSNYQVLVLQLSVLTWTHHLALQSLHKSESGVGNGDPGAVVHLARYSQQVLSQLCR